MEIIRCLEESEIIKEFKILDFKVFEDGFYIKIVASLTNDTELHIREYTDEAERNYSYHWQTGEANLIMRWDNSPHHKHLRTHPHHVHLDKKVRDNSLISCNEILKYIEEKIKRTI